ncbi:uncharacterized protein LOC119689759 [Teleopsis dalmanni]|uniref:uncharacterized protein LOC119689759 n=1 Tax=Teleopsis dalmanni TaxID=139649 RepID=UPI0018CC9FF0|nr:uncharacterized protein LOC119689759 [Teleopsis dalmanni]
MNFPHNNIYKELIEDFKSERCLWEVKSDAYKNKYLKTQAWNKLLQRYKKTFPDATLEDLKKKINGMRNCYRRELNKVKKSAKSSVGAENLYVPSLWYYKDLQFLQEHKCQFADLSTSDVEDVEDKATYEPPRKKKMHHTNFLAKAQDKNTIKDDADIYGQSWAVTYRKLSSEQQVLAKLGIEKLLAEGQMNKLTYESVAYIGIPPETTAPPLHYSNAATPYKDPLVQKQVRITPSPYSSYTSSPAMSPIGVYINSSSPSMSPSKLNAQQQQNEYEETVTTSYPISIRQNSVERSYKSSD